MIRLTPPRVSAWAVAGVTLLVITGGCTVHPPGEREERRAASAEGRRYEHRAGDRAVPPLAADATPEELVRYALLANAELEQRYWEWRSAIEQIPQDGTQPTNLVLFAGVPVTSGSTAFDRTTVTVANDPMADIQWPSKPAAAARRALENARAAGLRFQRAGYELRRKVLDAYYEYALAAELVRLERANADLLRTAVVAAEAGYRAGKTGQSDVLRARNELDLSENQIAESQSRLPALRATLNAVLGRAADATLAVPRELPPRQETGRTDEQIVHLAAERNPELAALDREVGGRKEGLRLAKLQYVPDFSLSVGTDLAGTAQNLMGMVTVPLLRYEAINAAVAQAEANLRATESMRRQSAVDLQSRVVSDLTSVRDADRQLDLLNRVVLPRARQTVDVTRSAYEAGRATLLDLLDGQRALIALERLRANLRVSRESQIADLEAATATRFVPEERHTSRGE